MVLRLGDICIMKQRSVISDNLFHLGEFNWLRSNSLRKYSVSRIRSEVPQCEEQSHEDSYSNSRRACCRTIVLHLQ